MTEARSKATPTRVPDMRLTAVLRREGDTFVAWCPEVDVASQGPSVDEALANLKEAVTLFLEDEEAPRIEGTPLITTFEVPDEPPAEALGP